MHELGIVYEVINIVDNFAKLNNLTKVETIVLEVGQLSQAIPRFIEECYPAAVDETEYEDTELQILILDANGECRDCKTIYNVVENKKVCPTCSNTSYKLISGQEFNIKEVIAY